MVKYNEIKIKNLFKRIKKNHKSFIYIDNVLRNDNILSKMTKEELNDLEFSKQENKIFSKFLNIFLEKNEDQIEMILNKQKKDLKINVNDIEIFNKMEFFLKKTLPIIKELEKRNKKIILDKEQEEENIKMKELFNEDNLF